MGASARKRRLTRPECDRRLAGRRARSGLALAALLSAVAGCSSSTSLAAFQPQISNAADNFQAQATGVNNVTTTLTYNWANSGTRATVNHATVTTAGATLLVIKDGTGTTVYSKALSASLNEPTGTGAPTPGVPAAIRWSCRTRTS